MNIRSFKDFENYISEDESNLKNKVNIITDGKLDKNSPFYVISSLNESRGLPVLMCGDLAIKTLNESNPNDSKIYNSFNLKKVNVFSKYIGENFIPKTIKNRNSVKTLRFPIVAKGKSGSNIYKSFHMFKKSENDYTSFQEKPIPRTKYDVLMFRDQPISVYEKINDTYTDMLLSKNLQKKITSISSKIIESHGLDVYHMKIYESIEGGYYLGGVRKCSDLDQKQAGLLYIKIYEDHYKYNIPTWFKNKINSLSTNC